jgi:hypothetical protein
MVPKTYPVTPVSVPAGRAARTGSGVEGAHRGLRREPGLLASGDERADADAVGLERDEPVDAGCGHLGQLGAGGIARGSEVVGHLAGVGRRDADVRQRRDHDRVVDGLEQRVGRADEHAELAALEEAAESRRR